MSVYIRLVGEKGEGTAPISGELEKVHSPDDATLFSYDDASFVRQKAYERWSSCDWQMVETAGHKYHVSSATDFIEDFTG